MDLIAVIMLVVTVMIGGPGPAPYEDDLRNEVAWSVATIIAASEGYGLGERYFEVHPRPHGRGSVWVGVAFPARITECAIGTHWQKPARAWTPLAWECP